MIRSKAETSEYESVHQDWISPLPEAKQRVFQVYSGEMESSYLMFSVALDEAIGLREGGMLRMSREMLSLIPSLCVRTAAALQSMLRSLELFSRHGSLMPSVTILSAENFQGRRGQNCARKNSAMSRILLTRRSAFLNKSRILQEMVENLRDDFSRTAKELLSGDGRIRPTGLWQAMEADHFDLNTCLREVLVMLRSFLRVLPEDQLARFQRSVSLQMTSAKTAPNNSGRNESFIPQATRA